MNARTDKSPETAEATEAALTRAYGGPSLTQREGEVFRLMAAGLTNDGIAAELNFGVDAAKIHARHIFGKLKAKNRTHAVSIGFTTGLLDREDIGSLSERLIAEGVLEAGAQVEADE
jgi:DNA-binding NarL/FixJ family response regulator